MINPKLEKAINEQINAELYSAYLYLSMSAYLESLNLPGFATWMRVQFEEEQFHAMRFFTYLNDRGGRVVLEAIEKPQFEWNNVIEVFEKTLEHEIHVTNLLNNIADIAEAERDRPTKNLMIWFIDEQVEEESTAEKIINELKMINGEGHGMLMLDRELGARVFTPPVV
ncbi:ferritin [Fusibacter ferrireducens]|uniref:Ferritin n=1 Tax=Fusibacter ferrireducens TaxID=2785058 RepID=A0ABR9ZRV7_9FIRM|nr:ferritin [Fusibacter ferrireducens]MBF4693192.1 ferritin [Fusibacter ferrireducens]